MRFVCLASLALVAVGCTAPAVEPATGSGTVTGTIGGRAFDEVAASFLAGQPDDPAQTTVIYVFGAAVVCADLAEPGWDTRIADATQALEIKLIGLDAGTYPIPADGRPAQGESDVNYTVSATSDTPSEVSAQSGTVTLTAIVAGTSADGSFDLTFPDGSVSGDFSSSFCAGAREP